MDPNETLRVIRLLIKQMEVDEDIGIYRAHASELAEHVNALDSWMSTGGFNPDAWKALPDPWRAAVLHECFLVEGCYCEADPAKTLRCLIDWHVRNATAGIDVPKEE